MNCVISVTMRQNLTKKTCVLFFVILVKFQCLAIHKNSGLTVAVVEYEPLTDPDLTPAQRLNGNAANYLRLLESLNESKVDLVVYPEATLEHGIDLSDILSISNYVNVGENPCSTKKEDYYSEHIRNLSCAAKFYSTFMVVNTLEKSKCLNTHSAGISDNRNCAKFGHKFYNTDIVFNGNGTILARYRKYNLYGEFQLDRPEKADQTIFRIRGLEFGVFTCFDILFQKPAEQLVDKKRIKRFIFPSMWYSQLPFFTSLQVQQMWAYTHNVKLYAAGANSPRRGSGGTGIYHGMKGPVVFDIIAKGGSKIYVHRETSDDIMTSPPTDLNLESEDIDALAKDMQYFRLSSDKTVYESTSKVLDFDEAISSSTEQTICHKSHQTSGHFCCKFTIETSRNIPQFGPNFNRYTYQMVAFSGVKSFDGDVNGGLDFCAILACLNASLTSCGRRFEVYENIKWPVTFQRIQIEARFTVNANETQYPTSLLSSIRPISPAYTSWTWREVILDKVIERKFTLNRAQNRLMVFGILGRNFHLDVDRSDEKPLGYYLNNVILCISFVICTVVLYTS